MDKYYIAWNVDGKVEAKEVEGSKVDIDGLKKYTFFVHKAPDRKVTMWRVSESSTGYSITGDSTTKAQAIEEARERYQEADCREVLRDTIRDFPKLTIPKPEKKVEKKKKKK